MIVVINAQNMGVTEYPVDVVDVVSKSGIPAAVTSTAEITFTGTHDGLDDEDNPIDISWSFKTGQMNFGANDDKRCDRAYLLCSLANQATLTSIVDQMGARREVPRPVHKTGGTKSRNLTVKLPHGLKSALWGFELEGEGSALVDSFAVLPQKVHLEG